MHQKRGIFFLADPAIGPQKHIENVQGLVFSENGSLLSRAQEALWRMRREYEWICAAAQGDAACIALALAAQLPVERVALLGTAPEGAPQGREMRRLKAYARRNLALITADILLIGAQDSLVNALLRGCGRCRLCLLDTLPVSRLTDPWETLCEKNLLIQGKCV